MDRESLNIKERKRILILDRESAVFIARSLLVMLILRVMSLVIANYELSEGPTTRWNVIVHTIINPVIGDVQGTQNVIKRR